jgi:hypothetical protein
VAQNPVTRGNEPVLVLVVVYIVIHIIIMDKIYPSGGANPDYPGTVVPATSMDGN